MLLRVNDILVGVVAGAICSVLAAAFEAGILAFRFFSLGHVGGHFGSGVLIIALAGGVAGGLIGMLVGALFGGRRREPVVPHQ